MAGYLLAVATIKLLILEPGQRVNLDDARGFAIVVVVPLTATFVYFLAVFTFGLSGDLAARQSMYPARMFALPVTTAALAGWPMLYGSAVMAILWMATRLFALWPSGFDVPVIWPALLAAALLAWTQALTWMPYGLPGLRVVVSVLCLAVMDTVVLLAIQFKAPEPVMVAILAPLTPIAYLVARFAVARARRGDVPDWRPMFVRRQIAQVPPNRQEHFASPAHAQMWFEWRRHGWTLPAWVGILLPFELALLFATDNNTPVLVFLILLGVLLTPPLMAAFAAATVRKTSPSVSDSYGVTPFIATRPMTSAALIAATLKMTIWSTLAAWLLVLVAIPLALVLSDTGPVVIERARRLTEAVGTPRAVVFVLLLFSGFITSTWKQLVQTLYIGLTGREWVIRSSLFLALVFLAIVGPVAQLIHDSRVLRVALWNAMPWILAALVCSKISAASWIATRLQSSGLLSDRTLVTGAACWVVGVLGLYALLGWLVSGPLIPRYFLVLVAILAIPLARLSAAPLALAWNRHR